MVNVKEKDPKIERWKKRYAPTIALLNADRSIQYTAKATGISPATARKIKQLLNILPTWEKRLKSKNKKKSLAQSIRPGVLERFWEKK